MGTYTVTRSLTVEAPADRVLGLVTDLRRWREWSPWEDLDPQLERTYAGAESGPGQRYTWRGNRKAGEGMMEVLEADDRSARIAVNFRKPFRSSSISSFTLDEAARGGTRVTWAMEGQQNAVMGLIGRFYSMDKMMGPDFEKGLARLKAASEQA